MIACRLVPIVLWKWVRLLHLISYNLTSVLHNLTGPHQIKIITGPPCSWLWHWPGALIVAPVSLATSACQHQGGVQIVPHDTQSLILYLAILRACTCCTWRYWEPPPGQVTSRGWLGHWGSVIPGDRRSPAILITYPITYLLSLLPIRWKSENEQLAQSACCPG